MKFLAIEIVIPRNVNFLDAVWVIALGMFLFHPVFNSLPEDKVNQV